MKKIKKYILDKKEQLRLEEEARIRAGFRVVECGGSLWLTHCGVAFMKVASDAKAEEVARTLNETRETAIEYARL